MWSLPEGSTYRCSLHRRRSHLHNMMLGMIVLGVAMVYLLVIWLRLKG